MSYILDALKKSEKERQRGQLPSMLTAQDIIAERPRRKFHWAYLIAAGLVLNAGFLVWWIGFPPKANEISVLQAEGTSSSLLQSPEPTRNEEKASRISSGSDTFEESSSLSDPARVSKVVTATARALTEELKAEPKKDSDISATRKPDRSSDLSVNTHKADENSHLRSAVKGETIRSLSETMDELGQLDKHRIYRLREIPVSIRETLPSFAISALMYSDLPASRVVRINDEMMHEGHELASGLKLQEIAIDGVIFRYHDAISFWVGVK